MIYPTYPQVINLHTIPSYYNNNIYIILTILRFIHIFCGIICYFVDNPVYIVGISVCIAQLWITMDIFVDNFKVVLI